jgi:hypothetical protein
MHHNAEEC